MINEIKKKIAKIDYIAIGTLLESYRLCGKANCLCKTSIKNHAHGPYYILTRKYKGKTITKSLNPQQAKLFKKALKNMKILNQLLEEWKLASFTYIYQIE
ncbi:MAG: hypothetical protein A2Y62_20185 [Candidatus Fischerbacteria bacterium RBG_13_37_8]|uniref:DUF6788 domain-containing protein n=1 Tax=Candidatus Fischerbacteria bacterium RBG_13_37_8 TaxID=1817863 RepID=A0A1F5VFD0_9BACT|nr:MAG: hypothetical protein A2Y62_20185 [Candidatus Fischerbacteria bacterium RBG_13_37_8]